MIICISNSNSNTPGNEVTDDLLANAFRKYKSFQKSKVIRDKQTGKTRGFGFVSFAHPEDMVM